MQSATKVWNDWIAIWLNTGPPPFDQNNTQSLGLDEASLQNMKRIVDFHDKKCDKSAAVEYAETPPPILTEKKGIRGLEREVRDPKCSSSHST